MFSTCSDQHHHHPALHVFGQFTINCIINIHFFIFFILHVLSFQQPLIFIPFDPVSDLNNYISSLYCMIMHLQKSHLIWTINGPGRYSLLHVQSWSRYLHEHFTFKKAKVGKYGHVPEESSRTFPTTTQQGLVQNFSCIIK